MKKFGSKAVLAVGMGRQVAINLKERASSALKNEEGNTLVGVLITGIIIVIILGLANTLTNWGDTTLTKITDFFTESLTKAFN